MFSIEEIRKLEERISELEKAVFTLTIDEMPSYKDTLEIGKMDLIQKGIVNYDQGIGKMVSEIRDALKNKDVKVQLTIGDSPSFTYNTQHTFYFYKNGAIYRGADKTNA